MPLVQRLPALRMALQATRKTFDFCLHQEKQVYVEEAKRLALAGAHVVVFGHTHLAKRINLDGSSLYLNTGTWANLVRFPEEVLVEPPPGAADPLVTFVDDMKFSRLQRHIVFSPTYAHILLADGQLASANLCEFNGGDA